MIETALNHEEVGMAACCYSTGRGVIGRDVEAHCVSIGISGGRMQ